MTLRFVSSPSAAARLDAARRWLRDQPSDGLVRVVATTRDAAARLVREATVERGALFGWEALSSGAFVVRAALLPLAGAGRSPAGSLAHEALAARTLDRLRREAKLGRYAKLADRPGLPRALAATAAELVAAEVPSAALREVDAELAEWIEVLRDETKKAGLADRADVLAAATSTFEHATPQPTLLLDLPLESPGERAMVRALRRGPLFVAAVEGEEDTWAEALEQTPERLPSEAAADLGALHRRLFRNDAVDASEDTSTTEPERRVRFLSAAGESRECVEIARLCVHHAREGVPFDRMAVVTRSASLYRPYLVAAFGRAGIPLRLSRGTVLPDPAGRALLALLDCRSEAFSARAFAEYLSLGQSPLDAEGAPPAARDVFAMPDAELVPFETELRDDEGRPDAAPHVPLRVPRHWESLLVDAAVIGGIARWERRLDVLDANLAREAETLDADDPVRDSLARRREELDRLRAFALPLLRELEALPSAATWGAWLDALRALATRALREPERVVQVLGELAPLAPVGPVELLEVRGVLAHRLGSLVTRPSAAATGVHVLTPDEARGVSADVVFVPGLAEHLFPEKLLEDPLLLDARRRAISGAALDTREIRARRERQRLAIAVGAASAHLVVSWPRADLERARPRVPSFYALEIARAAHGALPGWSELAETAAKATSEVVGWPAPDDPHEAIDEAEFDLAALRRLASRPVPGGAAYLLDASPTLRRAFSARARRWNVKTWTPYDGLVDAALATALARYRPATKPFSASALEQLAACPYRFALRSFFKLAPREVPEAIEDPNPRQRGTFVHDVQFDVLTRLRAEKLLPLDHPQKLARARLLLDETVASVADEHEEELAPAIPRVWRDFVDAVRLDLHEWLGRLHDAPDWVPVAFELTFGVERGRRRDPASRKEPVDLKLGRAGDVALRFRGSIDLVEAKGDALRATDHKTGKARYDASLRIGGGRALQPVLYALALEALHPDRSVVGGRLYYCTSRGGFVDREVPLDDDARDLAGRAVHVLERMLARGFFPAAPGERECEWCDYRVVCGTREARRVQRKDPRWLEPLIQLRRSR
ncbi:MAG: PD-(D/E)XK nuclease family protein [Sandaracinus sp.]|nr:PD-(D/E)XK nuclease family protein [Sandaracinus sp.]